MRQNRGLGLSITTGRIGIIDHDVVEVSNLQRQILHDESKVGMPKAESAARALRQYLSPSFNGTFVD